MSYEERIRESRAGMSKSFAKLADFILDSYVQAALMTATELAYQVDVDAATVVRFAQRLGYSGFPELQSEIKSRVLDELKINREQSDKQESIPGVVNASLVRLREVIEQTRLLLDPGIVEELVNMVGEARRIILLPEALGQGAAYNLMNLMEQGGFLVVVVQPGATDLARSISTAAKNDLLLAVDVAGDSPLIARALTEAQSLGIPTAAIAAAASHESAVVAGHVLAAQSQPSVGLGLIVVDAIIYAFAEALRWQYRDRFAGADKAIEALFERIQTGE